MALQEAIKIDSTVLGFAEKQVNLITNLKVYPQLLFDIYIESFTNSKKINPTQNKELLYQLHRSV